MNPPEMCLTEAQRKVLSITPKFTSLLSLIGSSYIIYHQMILLEKKRATRTQQHQQSRQQNYDNNNNIPNNRNSSDSSSSTYNRILFSLSFCDLISSTGFFMSTWPIPKDDTTAVYNMGTQNTCDIQGFTLHFGFTSVALYNTCLSVYFLMFVREKVNAATMKRKSRKSSTINIQEEEEGERSNPLIKDRKIIIELLFHFISLILPLITATLVYRNGYFNPTTTYCYISEKPKGCDMKNSQVECIRGENYRYVRMVCIVIPMFICLTIIIVSMILLYKTVRDLELQTLKKQKSNNDKTNNNNAEELHPQETIRSSNNHTNNNNNNNNILLISQTSRKIFRLAIFYVAGVLICWIPIFIRLIITKFFVDDPTVLFISGLLLQIFGPSQGMFNAMIYRGFNPLTFLCRHFLLFCVTDKKKKKKKKGTRFCDEDRDDSLSIVDKKNSVDESWSYDVFE